jgi:hypothetical protein
LAAAGAEGAGEAAGRKGVGGSGESQGGRVDEHGQGEGTQSMVRGEQPGGAPGRPELPPGVLSTLGGVKSLGDLCWDIFSTQPAHAKAA